MTTDDSITITKTDLRFLLDHVEFQSMHYFKKAQSAGKKGDKVAQAFWQRELDRLDERTKPLKEISF